jgi:HEPN domain-containing protein
MPHEESAYPADWLHVAGKDLQRARLLLGEHDAGLAGFCLQQAVEKYLKAFLLSRGWRLRRTHNLDALLDEAIVHDASLEDFRGVCQKTTAFYFVERYPFVIETGITLEDVRNALQQAEELIDKLQKISPGETTTG